MNPLTVKLQEAAREAAHILHEKHHPHAALIEQMRFVQEVGEENRLYVCLPVPESRACLLFPHKEGGLPTDKLQQLSVAYWADKLIGYVNAAVEDGLLPPAAQMQGQAQSGQEPVYRLSDKERVASL